MTDPVFAVITTPASESVEKGDVAYGWNEVLDDGIADVVFYPGELLILDAETGREVGYPGRKPLKWDIDYETFEDLDAAIDRVKEVMKP